MLELHLFVNPLGMRCLRCEKDVLKIDRDLNTKISYQFVPLFNMKTIDSTLKYYHLNPHDLAARQQVSKTLNQIILDYKAALFQGRKRGRHYLLQLQSALINQGLNSPLPPEGMTDPLNLPAPGRRQSVYSDLRLRTLLCFW